MTLSATGKIAGRSMLKRLELVGFKSFADRTAFDFADGLTGIIGPNGSGKSNVVDAVRWVLGEQSAKSLRGGEMTDVIFNGSASRRTLGMAEVCMVFDNSKRQLASQADEVRLAKQIAMQANEIDRMQNIIDRFGAKATKASMAHSLEKRIDRLKASGPESAVARKTLKLRLPEPPHSARTVL